MNFDYQSSTSSSDNSSPIIIIYSGVCSTSSTSGENLFATDLESSTCAAGSSDTIEMKHQPMSVEINKFIEPLFYCVTTVDGITPKWLELKISREPIILKKRLKNTFLMYNINKRHLYFKKFMDSRSKFKRIRRIKCQN